MAVILLQGFRGKLTFCRSCVCFNRCSPQVAVPVNQTSHKKCKKSKKGKKAKKLKKQHTKDTTDSEHEGLTILKASCASSGDDGGDDLRPRRDGGPALAADEHPARGAGRGGAEAVAAQGPSRSPQPTPTTR